MTNNFNKIMCDTELIELVFAQNEQARLFVGRLCKKILIIVEEAASVKIIIEYDALVNLEVECEAILKNKASLQLIPLFFTEQSIQQKFIFFIVGNQSVVNLSGLAVLSNDDTIKIETLQRHQGVGTKSSVEILSLVDGKGSFGYQGIIHIEKQASDTEANQQNKNILLSQASSVKSIPIIEVLNKNVRCFHGSAIGKFDKDQVWYLQNRGLDKVMVQKILIDSFCDSVIKFVPWKKEIQKNIQKKVV